MGVSKVKSIVRGWVVPILTLLSAMLLLWPAVLIVVGLSPYTMSLFGVLVSVFLVIQLAAGLALISLVLALCTLRRKGSPAQRYAFVIVDLLLMGPAACFWLLVLVTQLIRS